MIYAKISDLGGMHHRLGVRAAHMPIMQQVLFATLGAVSGDKFTDAVQAAWIYVWDYMTVAMAQTLEDEGSILTLVMDSWDTVLETKTAKEVDMLTHSYLFLMYVCMHTYMRVPACLLLTCPDHT